MTAMTRALGAANTSTIDHAATWEKLVARLAEAEAADASTFDNPDDAIDAAGFAIDAVMSMPAPHAAAACWKLDWFFRDGGDSTAVYDKAYLAQAIADYRRFLGEQPASQAPLRPEIAEIDTLAHRIQHQARRVLALVRPARGFMDEAQVPFGEPFTEAEGQHAEFADVLLSMVEETAGTLKVDGHRIEQLGLSLRRADAQVQA